MVPQGKWNIEKIIVQRAVTQVHPLSINKVFKETISKLNNFDSCIYAIIAIGSTISFAGKPNINANNITPSNPKKLANGSKKLDNNFVFAEEWNLKLKCLEDIKDNINYIAIRSHNIKLCKETLPPLGIDFRAAKDVSVENKNKIDVFERLEKIRKNN